MRTITPIHTLLVLTALMVQVPSPSIAASNDRLNPGIIATAEAYRKAMLAGDAAGAAATYTEDGIAMPSCRPPVKGRAAIERYYRELFSAPARITGFTFSYWEAVARGDLGYATGAYQQKLSVPPGHVVEDTGKFVAVVKRTASGWQAVYVIYNSDHPDATTPIPTTAMVLPMTPPLVQYLSSLFR